MARKKSYVPPGGKRRIEVFPVTQRGIRLAEKLSALPGEVVIHNPPALRNGGLSRKVKEAFASSRALVFISSTGIAVREVAPLLKGKHLDPAVIAIDGSGRFAVSLLSGHLGGANALTRAASLLTGAKAVVTTATDSAGLPSIEDVIERFSFAVEDTGAIKEVNSAILEGRPVTIIDGDPRRLSAMRREFSDSGVFRFRKRFSSGGAFVLVSWKEDVLIPGYARGRTLVLRPREVVLGVGCRRGVTPEEVRKACLKALKSLGASPLSVRNIATIDVKRDELGLIRYAEEAGLGIDFYTAVELARVPPPSGASRAVMDAVGAPAVSEPAAILSSGATRLWMRKKVFGRVTIAAARARSLS